MNVKLSQAEKIQVLNGNDLYRIMQRILKRENKIDRDKEHLWTVGLNTANQVLYVELISLGSSRMTLVEPMQVFRVAVLKGAVKLIIAHNHPSGVLKPSAADLDMTDRLMQSGAILEIEVIDHLIISEKTYYSFEGNGLLAELKGSRKYLPDYRQKEALKKEVETEVHRAGMREVARKMKARGYPPESIAEVTGLSESSIKKLKQKDQ